MKSKFEQEAEKHSCDLCEVGIMCEDMFKELRGAYPVANYKFNMINRRSKMIDINVKVRNDHCSFNKWFRYDCIYLSIDSPEVKEMVEETKRLFAQPVEQVDVKINMKDI